MEISPVPELTGSSLSETPTSKYGRYCTIIEINRTCKLYQTWVQYYFITIPVFKHRSRPTVVSHTTKKVKKNTRLIF